MVLSGSISPPRSAVNRKFRAEDHRETAGIEAGAAERDAREKADFDAKMKARAQAAAPMGGGLMDAPRLGLEIDGQKLR